MADTSQQPQSTEALPGPVTVPATETANSLSVGFVAADPTGPEARGEAAVTDESLIGGEFKSQEDLLAAYQELKKAQQAKDEQEQKDEAKPEEEEADDPNVPKVAAIEVPEETAAELKEKGLDVGVFRREYERTGGLSEESYAKLAAAGFDKDTVNDFINGQRVMVESQIKEVKDSIGGDEAFDTVVKWAAVNMTETEKQAYNRVLETSDPALIKLALAGVKARYDAENGKDPDVLVTGSATSTNDGQGRFKSWPEATRAISDPRYSSDPAYRKAVEEKLIRSNI